MTAYKAVRSGLLWGCVFGAYVATQALAYASAYKTLASRASLVKEFGSNAGIAAIVGPARNIGTVPGYTAWKCLTVLAIIASVWGLLTGTRLLRGEEDAGRWELLLSGQTTRRSAASQELGGVSAGVVTMWIVTAVIVALVGRSSKVDITVGGALYLALAVVSGAAMFVAVATLTSQLAATRRQAAGYAGAVLGVSYGLRMIADSGTGVGWLRWASPLGWIEELQPLTVPRPLALMPIVGLTMTLAVLAVYFAGSRDLAASTLPDRTSGPPHTRLLFGPTGLTMRIARPTILGWVSAVVAISLLLGLIAKSAGEAILSSPTLKHAFDRLGVSGSEAYLGVSFLIVATILALIGAGQITAARSEEAEGRLDQLLVRPLSRSSWFAGRLLIAAAILTGTGLLAGILTWAGAAIGHARVGFMPLLEAGLNIVPPGLCVLGVGALVLGLWPRATSVSVYGVLAWSFLIELVGGVVGLNHWLLDTSVFHQMTAAPAVAADWTADAVLLAIGTVAALAGGIAFRDRDLLGE